MTASSIAERLAVCSWSLRPAGPAELIGQLRELGIPRVQLALDPLRQGGRWAAAAERLAEAGVEIVSGMFTCVGEDYGTLESIRRTGGVAPDETWDENWRNIRKTAELARRLRFALVSFHAGFLPDQPGSSDYGKLMDRVDRIAGAFAAAGCTLALETGQENAAALKGFLDRLGRGDVGANFDPANMILYGMGDPVAAVRTLGGRIRQVHVKDATATKVPGTWGTETSAGAGEVNWPSLLAALAETGFAGHFCIEREGGADRPGDIAVARDLLLGR